jgi:hypothetical protein
VLNENAPQIDSQKPETHEWRKVTELQPGDFVHRWGDDLEVKTVEIRSNTAIISYLDTDNTIKTAEYKLTDELRAKRK